MVKCQAVDNCHISRYYVSVCMVRVAVVNSVILSTCARHETEILFRVVALVYNVTTCTQSHHTNNEIS